MSVDPKVPEPEVPGPVEPKNKKERPKNRNISLELSPEVIEDLKLRYGVIDEPSPTPEIESEQISPDYLPEPKPLEVVVADTVGEISPILLGLGIFGGFLLFILLVGGILAVVLYGGIGVSPLSSEPVVESFDAGASENWHVWKLEEANPDEGETAILQEAVFVDGGYRLTNSQSDALFWSSAGLTLGPGVYEVDVTFETVEADTGAGLAVLLDDEQFFLFEIDPSGYVWIGLCEAGCRVATALTGGGWYAVNQINSDFWATNRLKLSVSQGRLIAYVNDEEIGFVDNAAIDGAGDVAFVVEAGDVGETSVIFDNFVWSPHP